VVFTAVEEADEANPSGSAKLLVKEALDIANQVKATNIVLYPYAHLSSSLSNPTVAVKVLKEAESLLKKEKSYKVWRAPFGWYKSFEVRCKGHPLSELSRSFTSAGEIDEGGKEKEVVSEALKAEKTLKSHWQILDIDGKLYDVDKFDYKKYPGLKIFANYEKSKQRVADKEPAHIGIMKRLELVDYEPASDSGNLRYYPKGRLIKKLLEEFVTDRTVEYGGVEVETPIMYDMKHPTLERYLNKFPARQYQIDSDKRMFFLRFAACFGQFLMAHDATISYRNLPLKLYELTRYSFRREQSGEVTGLRRLRAFTMPDVHALCADMKQAKQEFLKRFELCLDTQKKIGFTSKDLEFAVRMTTDFWKENKDMVVNLVKRYGKPALIELWDERKFYFILKYEFNFVDNLNKASALSTDQIDVENGERYDMTFTGKDGKKHHPVVLHCSPSGAIERVMYALLEQAAKEQDAGRTPSLPYWLSPTQVRLIPLNETHLEYCEKLADEFHEAHIRVDIDDNTESIGKRIRTAAQDWNPFILVIGDKEVESGKFQVRVRGEKDASIMKKEELLKECALLQEGTPWKPLPLPRKLSKRPIFVG
ncbi:threonine--tRNA ligase, partial [Candidatus Woesearchaeota archaeon]|nr:threonine--tRNA ligase [Candidatus Woesearchaeota archaeon]